MKFSSRTATRLGCGVREFSFIFSLLGTVKSDDLVRPMIADSPLAFNSSVSSKLRKHLTVAKRLISHSLKVVAFATAIDIRQLYTIKEQIKKYFHRCSSL